jgi:integrase
MTEGRRGSVRQDDSGSWFYIVDIGSSTQRRQVRKRGFTSKRSAQVALTALLRSVDVGEYVEPSRLTLRRYVEEFWLPNAKMRLRPSTAHSYERNLRLHVLPTLGDVPLQKLTGPQLTQLYAALRDDGLVDRSKGTKDHKGLSVRTTRYVHTILGAVLKSAVKADLLHRNPADQAEPPRMTSVANGTSPMRTWSAAEVAQFLSAESETREYALWLLLATTGLRRGEALGLGWQHVDLDGKRLTIVRTLVDIEDADDDMPVWSDPKTAAGRRSVAIDDSTVAVLKAHKAMRAGERLLAGAAHREHDLVFAQPDGRPYHPERVTRTFQARAKQAGVRVIRLHDLRHTWATLALEAGIPAKVVQDRLGHSTVAITLNIYSHVTPQLQSDAAARVAAAIFGIEE